MKNYTAEGDVIPVTAPDDTDHTGGVSGDGILVGLLFGFAVSDFVAGGPVQIKTKGIFKCKKTASQAWTVGELLYWDDTTLRVTSTAGSNKKIGHATAVVAGGSGDVTGYIRLQGFAT